MSTSPMLRRRLTAEEAREYLSKPSLRALYAFLYRRRKAGFPVKTYRLGRCLRFNVDDLDRAMTAERSLHAVDVQRHVEGTRGIERTA